MGQVEREVQETEQEHEEQVCVAWSATSFCWHSTVHVAKDV